ncbi:MAG: efflux RND transporter periplasmic adaptor subunit [Candidatus Kapaibacteriota bacterium]
MKPKIISFLIVFLLLVNCNKEDKGNKTQLSEAPPSLQANVSDSSASIINLDEDKARLLNIKVAAVRKDYSEFKIVAPGVVFPAPENIAYVSTPISGRIVAIYAYPGQNVKKGQLLLEIESLEYGTLISELLQTKAELDYQKKQIERYEQLTERKISSVSELERAKSEYTKAIANFKAAESKLLAIGVKSQYIDKLLSSSDIEPHLQIYSPINGTVDKSFADLGKAVDALENLMTIVDVSKVWVKGFLSPEDVQFIAPGSKVCLVNLLSEQRLCDEKISSLSPTLDEKNSSVIVNIFLNAKNGFPKPGTNVRLEIQARTNTPVFNIPKESIAYDGDKPIVFVQLSPKSYEKRYVKIFKTSGENVLITSGLADGDKIALTNVFDLKALSRLELFSE